MKLTIRVDDKQNVIIMVDNNTATISKSNKCNFQFTKNVTAEEILQTIQEAYNQYNSTKDAKSPLSFNLTKKMHQILRDATLIQKVRYVILVGYYEVMSQDKFQDAINFVKFNNVLGDMGIVNNFTSEYNSKRIIAVHPNYVYHDEEIREGLRVMNHKHQADNPVFVDSEVTLKCALDNCADGSTLVIDGHWEHNKKALHGVWDPSTAEELAAKIAAAVNAVPGKIAHINLLGCESGAINPKLEGLVDGNRLFFKYKQKPECADRYMASQRNRAIYVSEEDESVFDPDSLAFKVLGKLDDSSIAVTATPRLLYPWPPENPIINIGSDSMNWKDEVQGYDLSTSLDKFCLALSQVKSVTQINSTEVESHPKRPWSYRIS